jgi:hypothetical protein
MKVFVAFSAPDFARDLADLTQRDVPEDLRRLNQRLEAADRRWSAWAVNSLGTVVQLGGGRGVVEIPAEKLSELEAQKDAYSAALSGPVAVGIGTSTSDAATALKVAERQGGDRIVLYRQGIEGQLTDKKPSDNEAFDKVFDRIIADDAHGAEGAAMEKAEGGQVGFHRPQAVAQPASPVAQTPDHSEAQAAVASINDPERPPPPEQTDAASLEDQFHSAAGAQQDQDAQQQDARAQEADSVRSRLATILEKVRGQAPVLAAMAKRSPETYDAVMSLIQGVIAAGRALQDAALPMTKSEVDIFDGVSRDEAARLAGELGVDLGTIDAGEWQRGVAHEREHKDVTNDPRDIARIALAHLKEDPDYYRKLDVLEKNDEESGLDRDVRALSAAGIPATKKQIGDGWPAFLHVGEGADEQISGISFRDAQNPARTALVHRSTKMPGGWQASHFDEKGPMSDTQHKTLADAIRATRQHTLNVDRVWRRGEVLEKGDLPGSGGGHKPQHPVGTKFEGGPSSDANPHKVGQTVIRHGNGMVGRVEARAGQVTAVADRHAAPILGQASHPISSRNPTGH